MDAEVGIQTLWDLLALWLLSAGPAHPGQSSLDPHREISQSGYEVPEKEVGLYCMVSFLSSMIIPTVLALD